MKRVLALLLCVLLVVSMLAACGSKDDDIDDDDKDTKSTTGETKADETKGTEPNSTEPKGTQPTQPQKPSTSGVSVGTILDIPEVTYNSENDDLYLCMYTVDLVDGNKVADMEIAIQDGNTDTPVVYYSNGKNGSNKEVYEVTSDGIVKYVKTKGQDSFTKDTTTTQDAMLSTIEFVMGIFEVVLDSENSFPGLQFKKTGESVSGIGEAYAYDVLSEGEVVAKIRVHKETGIIAELKNPQGFNVMVVTQMHMTNLPIPDYK